MLCHAIFSDDNSVLEVYLIGLRRQSVTTAR